MTTSNDTPKTTQLPLILEGETVSILLTKGFVTMVDAIDADLLQYKWRSSSGRTPEYARRAIRINGKQHDIFMHREIMERKLQRKLSSGEIVDHKNGDPSDNRRDNLRLATHSENLWNSRKLKRNTSGYRGVSFDRNLWRAQIQINGKAMELGRFLTAEEAYTAYCEAAKKYRGEFARLD